MTEQRNCDGLTFKQWLAKVDAILIETIGVSNDDLADWPAWDSWDSGETPEDGATYAIEEDGTFSELLDEM